MEVIRELQYLTTGIYVLTVREGEVRHGMSSSWVTQVSGDPPLVSAAVDIEHFSHELLERSGFFGLNVVAEGSKRLEEYFYSDAARTENNLEGFEIEEAPSGVPLLAEAFVAFECKVESAFPAGDHTLFVASIRSVLTGSGDRPLTSNDLDYVYLGTGRIVKRS